MRKLITISLLLLVMVAGCSFTTYAKEKTSGDFKYEVNDGLVTICKYTGSAKNVVIPEKIAGKEVYEIAKGAFQNCKNLVSIKIPRILCFRVGAFKNCKKLVSVDYEGTKEDWEQECLIK